MISKIHFDLSEFISQENVHTLTEIIDRIGTDLEHCGVHNNQPSPFEGRKIECKEAKQHFTRHAQSISSATHFDIGGLNKVASLKTYAHAVKDSCKRIWVILSVKIFMICCPP